MFNRPYYRIPSSEKVDLRLLWKDKDDRYGVIFFVKNLFDTVSYDNIGGRPGSGTASPYIAAQSPGFLVNRSVGVEPPRTYGVQLNFAF